MTIAGRISGFASTSASLSSLTQTGMASLSKTSLMTICSGSIRRPLGAALSIGITSRTISPGLNRSPHRKTLSSSCFMRCARRSFSSCILVPSMALTYIESDAACSAAELSAGSEALSVILTALSSGLLCMSEASSEESKSHLL